VRSLPVLIPFVVRRDKNEMSLPTGGIVFVWTPSHRWNLVCGDRWNLVCGDAHRVESIRSASKKFPKVTLKPPPGRALEIDISRRCCFNICHLTAKSTARCKSQLTYFPLGTNGGFWVDDFPQKILPWVPYLY